METKKIYRSKSNRVFTGVCGGLGDYFNIDPVIVRLIWVIVILISGGGGLLAYIIAAIVIPEISDDGQEKRSYGCLYVFLIILLASIVIPIILGIFGFVGRSLFSGAQFMGNMAHYPSFGLNLVFSSIAVLTALAGLAIIVVLLIVLIKKSGKKDE